MSACAAFPAGLPGPSRFKRNSRAARRARQDTVPDLHNSHSRSPNLHRFCALSRPPPKTRLVEAGGEGAALRLH